MNDQFETNNLFIPYSVVNATIIVFSLTERSYLASSSPSSIRKRLDSVSSQTSYRKTAAKDYPGNFLFCYSGFFSKSKFGRSDRFTKSHVIGR